MERILIVKLGAVGDVIHSLPILETLRDVYPNATIGWVVEEASRAILEGNPALDQLIILERKRLHGFSGVGYFRRWLRSLKEKRYDTVIDPHNLFKTGWIGWASGASVRIGFRKFREANFIFTNRRVRPRAGCRHAVDKYLSLLEPLGITEQRWIRRFPLYWDSKDEERIDEFWKAQAIRSTDRIVAINPSAGWPSKRWPSKRYARVADHLVLKFGARVLILWGPGEKPLAEEVAGGMAEKSVLACESNLKSLMVLLNRCRLLISGDTGPLHMAAALGVPTVALFGPSDPHRNGPYGEGHSMVASTLPPATHWQNKKRGSYWMEGITTDRVMMAAEREVGKCS